MVNPADASALIGNLGQIIGAIAGLGTAAAGLVDATKAHASGGISQCGFDAVEQAVTGLVFDPPGAQLYGRRQILATLKANWINGVATATQKATAKSLIHLGLNETNAQPLATATGLDADQLTAVARNIARGDPLSQAQITLLGRFDTIVSAILDAGYERGDQRYRNVAKIASGGVSVVLALFGGWALDHWALHYFASGDLALALVAGLIATPLAPVAKNLSSTVAAAVSAVGAVKLKR
jgi:hypothetical protein